LCATSVAVVGNTEEYCAGGRAVIKVFDGTGWMNDKRKNKRSG
jgi:hypothetical protein